MVEAKLNREYAVRILGVGALMVGMCVWSLYDGKVAWPRHNRSLEQVRPALLATRLTAEAWVAHDELGVSPLGAAFHTNSLVLPSKLIKKLSELKIPQSASEKTALYEMQAKRVQKLFESPVYNSHDLQTQFVQAAITLSLGLLAFLSLGLKARKRYCAAETGLCGSGFSGKEIPYSDLLRIDWAKWDDKGIVTLTFKSGERRTLDGWHFTGMPEVVAEIQKQRPDLCPKDKQP
ncbi:MAG: hypothetical protein WCK89_20980 [bacterium]